MSIKTPADLSKAVTTVLAICRDEESLSKLDPSELATLLRSASEVSANVAMHNMAMMNMANILNRSGGGGSVQ